MCPHRSDAPPLGGREHERTDVPEPGPLDVLFCQHPRGGEPKVDLGDNYLRPREVGCEAARILCLCRVIQLAPYDDLELGHKAAQVYKEPAPEPPVEQGGEVTHELEVALHPARRLGPLHLDGHTLPATQHGPVDLPDARRTERHRVERGEQIIDGSLELTLDYLLGHPCRHGRSGVLELLELGEYSLREYVRACGENLPELDEGRSQVVEGAPQPDTKVGREELLQALLLPPVPSDVEDEAETMAHQNAADLGEAPEVPRPGGPGDPSIYHARILLLQSRGRLGSIAAFGRGLRFACRRRRRRGTVLEHPHPVLELLDAEEKVLVVLPCRKPSSPETLLQRSVDQRSRPCRALSGAVHHVVDHRAALFALHATLLDERVHDLLHLVPRRSSGAYLQQDQTLQRFANRSAHNYLHNSGFTTYMITKAQAVRVATPLGGARGLKLPGAPGLVERKYR